MSLIGPVVQVGPAVRYFLVAALVTSTLIGLVNVALRLKKTFRAA